MVLWSMAGRQAAVHNLNLAQIAFEPLGALLAVTSSPSPRCSVPFWPLDAPLAAWYLYGIEPPPRRCQEVASRPGVARRHHRRCLLATRRLLDTHTLLVTRLHTLILDVWCLLVYSVPKSALGALLVWRSKGHPVDGGRRLARQSLISTNSMPSVQYGVEQP